MYAKKLQKLLTFVREVTAGPWKSWLLRLDDSVFAPPKQLDASEACINDSSNYILVIQKCFADKKEEDKTGEELRTSEFLVSCAFCFSLSRWKSRRSKVKAL